MPRATFHRKLYIMPLLGAANFIGVNKYTEMWLEKYTSVAESAEKPTCTGHGLGFVQDRRTSRSGLACTGHDLG